METLFSASEPCGSVGYAIYGMFDGDAAAEYDVELAAHLPPGDHIDIAMPTSMAATRAY